MQTIPPLEAWTIQLAASAAFVDEDGVPVTPDPFPTVTVRRLNADGSYEELEDAGTAVQVTLDGDPVVGVPKYTGEASWAVDGASFDVGFVTTDTALVALGKFFSERWVTVRVSQSAAASLEAQLDAIQAKTDLITTGKIKVISPLDAKTKHLRLYRGDTPLLIFEDIGSGWIDATNIHLAIRAAGSDGSLPPLKTLIGSVVSDTSISVQITEAFTADLDAGDELYVWDIQGKLVTLEIKSPIWSSPLTIVEDVYKNI